MSGSYRYAGGGGYFLYWLMLPKVVIIGVTIIFAMKPVRIF